MLYRSFAYQNARSHSMLFIFRTVATLFELFSFSCSSFYISKIKFNNNNNNNISTNDTCNQMNKEMQTISFSVRIRIVAKVFVVFFFFLLSCTAYVCAREKMENSFYFETRLHHDDILFAYFISFRFFYSFSPQSCSFAL